VVVVGAGIVGAACAYELARAGLGVHVIDRAAVASGTTGSGEGNVLLSDKLPGPELELAVRGVQRWRELAEELPTPFELERKGGVVTAWADDGLEALRELGARRARAGVECRDLAGDELWDLEPKLSRDVAGGAHYPEDMQVQPMLATASLLQGARAVGARVTPHEPLVSVRRSAGAGRIQGVDTRSGSIDCETVINAAGPWCTEVAAMAGAHLDVRPRRGFVLVTEPLPPTIRHKVFAAEYTTDVVSSDESLRVATVIEGTVSGNVLIGSSREFRGFDARMPTGILAKIAEAAIRLFPVLTGVRAIRAYAGFRPFSQDHLPIIGPDPEVAGLWHACGHEGAGIGLAPSTAELVTAGLTGRVPPLAPEPFDPARLTREPGP
jgi:glycine/D-amino acid oxidase-like deaminating enzyme